MFVFFAYIFIEFEAPPPFTGIEVEAPHRTPASTSRPRPPPYTWCLPTITRHRLVHSYNGNMSSEEPVRKSSRVKRRPERWTILRKLPVRVPIPEEVEESDDEDIAALAIDLDDMSLSDESASEDDYMSEDAEEDEVEEEGDARKKSREERLDEEYDDVDDDPDYEDKSDTDSVAPPAPTSSASSSSSSSSSVQITCFSGHHCHRCAPAVILICLTAP